MRATAAFRSLFRFLESGNPPPAIPVPAGFAWQINVFSEGFPRLLPKHGPDRWSDRTPDARRP